MLINHLGKINFIIMCEHQGRYQRCANWTLDLKNNVLNEHHVDELINASATITGKSYIEISPLIHRLMVGSIAPSGDSLMANQNRVSVWNLNLVIIQNNILAHDEKIVRLLDQRLDIGPAVTFGEVLFEGDESFKSKLPQILSCFTL